MIIVALVFGSGCNNVPKNTGTIYEDREQVVEYTKNEIYWTAKKGNLTIRYTFECTKIDTLK